MALQRQLGYPEVPRPRRFSDSEAKVVELEQRVLQLENRLKLLDNEIHGQEVDINSLMVKPGETAGVPSGWGKKAQVEAHPPALDRLKSGGPMENDKWDFQYPPMS